MLTSFSVARFVNEGLHVGFVGNSHFFSGAGKR